MGIHVSTSTPKYLSPCFVAPPTMNLPLSFLGCRLSCGCMLQLILFYSVHDISISSLNDTYLFSVCAHYIIDI